MVTRPSCEKGGQEERKKKGITSQGFSKLTLKVQPTHLTDMINKLGFFQIHKSGDLRIGNLKPPTKLVYTS